MPFRALSGLLPFVVLLTAGVLPPPVQAEGIFQILRNVEIPAGQTHSGDIVCIGCSVSVRGTVKGDIVVIWGMADLHGSAEDDIVVVLGGVRLGPGAKLNGDAVSIGVMVQKDATATIGGEAVSPIPLPNRAAMFGLIAVFYLLLLALAAAAYRGRAERLAAVVGHRAWLTLLLGILAATVATGLLRLSEELSDWEEEFALSVIGIVFVGSVPGYLGLSLWLGRRLVQRWEAARLAPALAGGLLFGALQSIPNAGMVLWLMSGILALGVAVRCGLGFRAQLAPLSPPVRAKV